MSSYIFFFCFLCFFEETSQGFILNGQKISVDYYKIGCIAIDVF